MMLFVDGLMNGVIETDIKAFFDGFEVIGVKITRAGNGANAVVTFKDSIVALKAMSRLNNKKLNGKTVVVKNHVETKPNQPVKVRQESSSAGRAQGRNHAPAPQHGGQNFPYRFEKKPAYKKTNTVKLKGHDKLGDVCFDVAFDVAWKALTPAALNPSVDTDSNVPECAPSNVDQNKEYSGYNRRWLTVDGRPAISPFTVKGAVEAAFANILGGCYRVTDRIAPHQNLDPGTFPYSGRYKRYRVAMDRSKPAIIQSYVHDKKNQICSIEIQPVEEYYYDAPVAEGTFTEGNSYHVKSKWENHKNFVDTTCPPLDAKKPKPTEYNDTVTYYGPYEFGMDMKLGLSKNKPDGALWKKHHHRFYKKKGTATNIAIPAFNFDDAAILMKKVYLGTFKRLPPSMIDKNLFIQITSSKILLSDKAHLENCYRFNDAGKNKDKYTIKNKLPDTDIEQIFPILEKSGFPYDTRPEGGVWHQDNKTKVLDKLDEKTIPWVYYTFFGNETNITNIGLNFQFKAIFDHADTVPADHKQCKNIKDGLCPRCALFGMTDDTSGREHNGYKGRFKSTTLIADDTWVEGKSKKAEFKFLPPGTDQPDLKKWNDKNGNTVAEQVLLPILQPPKPARRDSKKGGYFDRSTGELRGAKVYKHAGLTMNTLNDYLNQKNSITDHKIYSHKLRGYAQVVDKDMVFKGTLGVENCSLEEIAALMCILDNRLSKHGFKLGLGKALGMGSFESTITKVWVRNKEKDKYWVWNSRSTVDIDKNKFCEVVDGLFGGLKVKIDAVLKDIDDKQCTVNSTSDRDGIMLKYNDPGQHYWDNFE